MTGFCGWMARPVPDVLEWEGRKNKSLDLTALQFVPRTYNTV